MLLDYEKITKGLDIKGVIHVGAHTAEERRLYKCPVIWVEADWELWNTLDVEQKEWFAATDYNGEAMLNVMPFKAANSLLEPNLNKRRKDVYVKEKQLVPARRIETIQTPEYNFLNLDIQGAELNALKGCNLDYFDYIYTEVHKVETYKNCTQIEEIDNYLTDFERIETKWTNQGWGDAFYIKK